MNRIKSLRISDLERKLYDFYSELEIVETILTINHYIGDKLFFTYFIGTHLLCCDFNHLNEYVDVSVVDFNVIEKTFYDFYRY